MKILKRLRDLKVMEDTLEGLEARKSLNRKAAYVSLTFAILVTLLSASYMNTWVYFFSMFTPAATIGMRGNGSSVPPAVHLQGLHSGTLSPESDRQGPATGIPAPVDQSLDLECLPGDVPGLLLLLCRVPAPGHGM